MNLFAAGNSALSEYLGIVTDPTQQQAMNAEQIAEYVRRQGDPTNVRWPSSLVGMQNAWRPAARRPTMTLAEYDARRAAFRAQFGS